MCHTRLRSNALQKSGETYVEWPAESGKKRIADQEILRSLYYNSRICSQAAMKFSCCQTDKFVRVCLPGRQERCQNAVAFFGYLPAIGAGNCGNQSIACSNASRRETLAA